MPLVNMSAYLLQSDINSGMLNYVYGISSLGRKWNSITEGNRFSLRTRVDVKRGGELTSSAAGRESEFARSDGQVICATSRSAKTDATHSMDIVSYRANASAKWVRSSFFNRPIYKASMKARMQQQGS